MSANLTIPTLAFCDSYWDGEQFEGYTAGQKDPRALLPLDSFRAEFMGRQFGLRPEFLVYEGRPFTPDEALAVTLLHDVMVRPSGLGEKLEKVAAVWKAHDEFGVERAEFLPYWRNQDVLQVTPEAVCVSAYRRAPAGLLLVISNLGKAEVEAKVSLQLEKLGLPASGLQAVDMLTRTPVACSAGTVTRRLGPLQWSLVRVAR
jgi:enoyl-CoA hydratase/carnithine racemase